MIFGRTEITVCFGMKRDPSDLVSGEVSCLFGFCFQRLFVIIRWITLFLIGVPFSKNNSDDDDLQSYILA